jgi:hypothetical protein
MTHLRSSIRTRNNLREYAKVDKQIDFHQIISLTIIISIIVKKKKELEIVKS